MQVPEPVLIGFDRDETALQLVEGIFPEQAEQFRMRGGNLIRLIAEQDDAGGRLAGQEDQGAESLVACHEDAGPGMRFRQDPLVRSAGQPYLAGPDTGVASLTEQAAGEQRDVLIQEETHRGRQAREG